jgi:hypothetical protein
MNKQETVVLPKKSLRNLLEALHRFTDLENEIEDYLIFQNKKFVKSLNKARKEHLNEEVIDWSELKKKYGL